jgi:Abnormal spindle-like microcephaly-assoc'd, ASPM-SPD-2-Hydin/CARDB
VGWKNTSALISAVTDNSGNAYTRVAGPRTQTPLSQSIYYAENIAPAAAGANAVTVAFSAAAAYPDIRILEYSGAALNSPVDVSFVGAGGSSTLSSSPSTTTHAMDLILGANIVATSTSGPGSGFTSRLLSPDGDIAEDQIATTTGSHSATAPLSSSGTWIMQMVAFHPPIAATGSFRLSPSPVSLSVAQGNQGTSTLTTALSGGFNSSISLTASGAPTGTTASFSPSTLAAPGSGSSVMTITVGSATPAGTYYITVTGSGSGVQQSAVVTLTVTAASSSTLTLSLSPTSLSFGNTTIGDDAQLPVLVQNTGTGSVTLSSASVTGSGYTLSNLTLPQTLSAGQSTSLTVTFTPTTTGASTGTVSLTSNATTSPNLESLSGTGVYNHTVSLTWTASTSSGVLGYDVYRSTTSGGPYSEITTSPVSVTSYTDSAVSAGQTYYYVALTVTGSGESGYSNQTTANVPSP